MPFLYRNVGVKVNEEMEMNLIYICARKDVGTSVYLRLGEDLLFFNI